VSTQLQQEPTFTAPTKVCPHCGAQAQTTADRCPNCNKKYKRRTVLKVLFGLTLFGLVVIVGCAALIGTAADEAIKELDAEQQRHAITKEQFDSIQIGASESRVVQQLGKPPEDKQEFTNKGFLSDEPENSTCVYYNREGGEYGDVFQFCFDNGRLTGKNAY
jgi:hypothetical protein